MTKFFNESKTINVSVFDDDGFWLENTAYNAARGTALPPNMTENTYTPSSINMIAQYDAKNDEWNDEFESNLGTKFYDKDGREYQLNAHDAELPEDAILDAPPKHNKNTHTVLYVDGKWQINTIRIGEHYYDEHGNEHTITTFNFELPENHTYEPKPEKIDGFAFVLVDEQWIKTVDYREQTQYNCETQKSSVVTELGEIAEGYTLDAPTTQYHEWIDGTWTLTDDNAQRQFADVLNASITRIDDAFKSVVRKWAEFVEGYKNREAQAIAYQEANYSGVAGVYVSSFATAAGMTNKDAALLIIQQADGLRALQDQLEIQRMRKYELKQPKVTIEQIQSLADEICANIQALGDSYE